MVELEAKNIDIETIQLELDMLKEEKEELLIQLQTGGEVSESDGIHSLSEDELKSQNMKLR